MLLQQAVTQQVAANPNAALQIIKDIGPTAIAFLALALGAVFNLRALGFSSRTLKLNANTLDLQRSEDERKAIQAKLNEFYGPLRQLLGISEQLYEKFRYNRGSDFRTLTALLSGTQFSGNDKILLEQILEITGEIRSLIMKQSGMVTSPELRKTLSKAGAHFAIIRLAAEGKLKDELERFQDIVFPRELAPQLDAEIGKLQNRLGELGSTPSPALTVARP